jgi:hypothetical protein
VDATTDAAALTARLGADLARVAAFLDAVEGPAALLKQLPLDYGAQLFLRAQLRYVTGDAEAALADVLKGQEFFADWGVTLDHRLRPLHVTALAPK